MSPLRRLLEEITTAREAVSLEEIARRVGVSRDEAGAMVTYWVRKGRLTSEDIADACPATACGGCALFTSGTCSPTSRRSGPPLLAISRRRPFSGTSPSGSSA